MGTILFFDLLAAHHNRSPIFLLQNPVAKLSR
jgi:hypothetical protein